MKVPGYADIALGAKELLYGGKIGLFQYDKVLTVNAKTPQGVAVSLKAVEKDGALNTIVKMSRKQGLFSVDLIPSDPKVTVSVSQQPVDGLKVTMAGSLPNIQSTGKATVDYLHPYFTAKAACTMTAKPILDISAVVGHNGLMLGGNAIADVTQSKLNKWTAAAAYTTDNAVVSAHITDSLDTVRLTGWLKIDAASTFGGEIVHGRSKSDFKMALGYSHVNAAGDLSKVKLANDGNVQALYEFKLRPDLTLASSVSIHTLDVQAAPKLGFAIDHSP